MKADINVLRSACRGPEIYMYMSEKKSKKTEKSPSPPLSRRTGVAIRRSHANFRLGDHPKDYEFNDGVSDVVPGMSDSIQDLLDRFVKGQEIPIQGDPYYHDNLPDIERMNKIDREMLKRDVQKEIARNRQIIQDANKKSQKMKHDDQAKKIQELQDQIFKMKNGGPPEK